jgi:hypothetical protein
MTSHPRQSKGEAVADPATIETSAGTAQRTVLRPHVAPRQETREKLRIAIDARKLTYTESGLGNHTLNLV